MPYDENYKYFDDNHYEEKSRDQLRDSIACIVIFLLIVMVIAGAAYGFIWLLDRHITDVVHKLSFDSRH